MEENAVILKRLKALLVAHFGDDIHDVFLFGSRARGEAHKNSDYDVLIVLNSDYDWQYRREITSVVYDMELEYEIFIDTKVISLNELNNTVKGKHPLYTDAIHEGIRA